MPSYNLPDQWNQTGGLETTLLDLSYQVPQYPVYLLIFLFLTIFLSGSLANRKQVGSVNFAIWMAVAGLVTSTVAVFLYMIPLINLTTLTILVAITLVSAFFALFSKDD